MDRETSWATVHRVTQSQTLELLNTHARICMSMCAQSCLMLCDPMDCSPPDSSVRGILQARMLEQVAVSYSRGSLKHRDWTSVSCMSPALQADSLPLSHQWSSFICISLWFYTIICQTAMILQWSAMILIIYLQIHQGKFMVLNACTVPGT